MERLSGVQHGSYETCLAVTLAITLIAGEVLLLFRRIQILCSTLDEKILTLYLAVSLTLR